LYRIVHTHSHALTQLHTYTKRSLLLTTLDFAHISSSSTAAPATQQLQQQQSSSTAAAEATAQQQQHSSSSTNSNTAAAATQQEQQQQQQHQQRHTHTHTDLRPPHTHTSEREARGIWRVGPGHAPHSRARRKRQCPAKTHRCPSQGRCNILHIIILM
jgi:hypothetical protein